MRTPKVSPPKSASRRAVVEAEELQDFSVPSLERGLAILELLAHGKRRLGLVEIAQTLGYPNNSVFRITSALVQLGFLGREEESKKFFLTPKLLSVGLGAIHEVNVVERSWLPMRSFRDQIGETVALGSLLLHDAMGVVLAACDSTYMFSYRLQAGHRFELHCSGPGKAMMAFLPPSDQDRLLATIPYTSYTATTINSRSAMEKELTSIRKAGFALDCEEGLVGCHCVAAPILDARGYPLASVWASGPSFRFTSKMLEALGPKVMEVAAEISQRLAIAGGVE